MAVARRVLRFPRYARLVVFITAVVSPAFAQRQMLTGHVPQVVKNLNLPPVDRLSATQHVYLAIGVPLRDLEGAKDFLQKLYDPASPGYHQYLTPQQFTEKFGPTVEEYEAVIAFAKSSGFQIVGTHANRLLLDVNATAADIENAFQVRLFEYQHPGQARKFYAPDVEPSVPSALKIIDVSGLNNYAQPHPNSHMGGLGAPAGTPIPTAGSVDGGQYIGEDFRAAYVPGTPLTGAGQTVALVEFDGYFPSDITRYETLAGLPAVTLTNILLDSFSGTPTSYTGGVAEVSLDIEMGIAMAPGLASVMLYEGNPTNFIPNDVLSQIANDNAANQISCSWGWGGGPSASTDNLFLQMASQGQSFFVASGDSDAYPGSTADNAAGYAMPAESAYVTSVGGTTLSTAGPTNHWTAEIVWNWGEEFGSAEAGVGSSGGYSADYPIPSWQRGVNPANLGSATGRNFPDVALTADHVFVVFYDGLSNWFGGTSCAAPLWAGFTALANQQAATNNLPPVGFLNPAIYSIGTGTNYTTCFHDITTGNNEWSVSPGAYTALPGYDLCTGWGTPNGTNLINALLAVPPAPSLNVYGSFISGGNGDGGVDANDCKLLNVIIANVGGQTATGVSATVTSSTPGVIITQPDSAYPTIATGQLATNSAPFQISTSPTFVCGTPVSVSVVLSRNGLSTTNTLAWPSCLCPAFQATGGLSASSPTQLNEVADNGFPSSCSAPTACPGTYSQEGYCPYQAYSFTNTSSEPICVSVTLSTPCDFPDFISSAAYLGEFDPGNVCANFLGNIAVFVFTDTFSYSFSVPANTNFTVVVNGDIPGYDCDNYTITVAGLICDVDGGGSCPPVSAYFSGSPTTGVVSLTVTFTDTSIGSITNWFWSFGDGATTNVTTNSVVHAYNTPGLYTVAEIVTGPAGSSTNTEPDYVTVFTPFQAWQTRYFGSTTNAAAAPDADPYGKGISNADQFLAGLNPTNPASVFSIIAIRQAGGTNTVTWKTSGGDVHAASFGGPTVITNIVQGAVGAASGAYSNNFSDISGPLIIVPPGDTVTNYPDASGTNLFYRIRLGP
jgi:PKD repeat protein